MSLAPSTRIGPYEILAPIGAGGMGEVYRARDTRLGRDVALKILPESFARESDRLHRFEQEARAVAALNHPNILALFDIGQHHESPFLVSELLEGESLREVLDRGALPQRKTIEYGFEIALALAAAHEKGIVHRDLKPANVFVTREGRIKVLDFGLAKFAQNVSTAATTADRMTLTSSLTAAGAVMGTFGYMAPEQVRGEPADPRTDIFALGAILYEMLSGQRVFRRDTPAETMTAVLKEDPPELSDPVHPVSPALERIVRRCLEKNPDHRFQSAKDLSFALSALSGTDAGGAARAAAAPRKVPLSFWLSIVLALAVGAGAAWIVARRPPVSERMQFAIPVPGEVSHMALSRDGSMLAFVSPEENSGLPMLFVERVGSPDARLLPGTEGASFPFWSPDGANIAFFSHGKLEKVAISGGAPQFLAPALSPRGGSWGSRDVIIYAPVSATFLWRVNSDGAAAAPLTDQVFKDDISHRWPLFLPDGNHFLFWAGNFSNSKGDPVSGIYVGSLDRMEKKLVALVRSSFAFDSRYLFYANDERQLVSVPFDPSSATVSGHTSVVAGALGFQPSTYWAALTAAKNGTLIFNSSTGASLSALTWIDRSGKELGRLGEPAVMANPTLSPDENRVAVDISDLKANNVDIWLESTKGAANTRFTFTPEEDVVGVWSRDGSTLAYRSNFADGPGLLLKPASGLEHERMTFKASLHGDILPNSWSRDDRQILCTLLFQLGRTGPRLVLVPAKGGQPIPFLPAESSAANGMISPDGKWAAYASDESGNWEIYVTTFSGATGKWQVSRGGGTEPRWRGDGKEIFYIGPAGILMAVPVNSGSTFSTGAPTPLFQIHARAPISSTDIFTYDVTKDGKRFLVNRYVKPDRIMPLTIVMHPGTSNPSD